MSLTPPVRARVYTDQGYWRAVCFDCRADNAQRTYWRTPHTSKANAQTLLDEHTAAVHS